MLRAGTTLNRFLVVRALDEGEPALSWLLRDRESGAECMLKVVPQPADRLAMWLDVAAAKQAAVAHPAFLPVRAIVEVEGGAGVLFDVVDGPALAELLAEDRLRPEDAASLFEGVAGCVAAAHAAGLLHGDLSPASIHVAAEKGRIAPSVWGFGLAAAGGPREAHGYAAPESGSGAPPDVSADVFSLGCLLYELLSGEAAFPAGDLNAAARRTRPLVEAAPGTPKRIAAAVDRAIDPRPDRRFPSVEAFRVAVGQAQPTAPQASAPLPFFDFGVRTRNEALAWVVLFLAIGVFLLLAGGGLAGAQVVAIGEADRAVDARAGALPRPWEDVAPELTAAITAAGSGHGLGGAADRFCVATTASERIEGARDLARAVRRQIGTHAGRTDATVSHTQVAERQLDTIEATVREAESALSTAEGARSEWPAQLAERLGWIDLSKPAGSHPVAAVSGPPCGTGGG